MKEVVNMGNQPLSPALGGMHPVHWGVQIKFSKTGCPCVFEGLSFQGRSLDGTSGRLLVIKRGPTEWRERKIPMEK